MNNIFLTTKRTKAIKVLIDNLDSDNEAIQCMRYNLRDTDTGDMTLEEAQSIVDRMKPEKKDAVDKCYLRIYKSSLIHIIIWRRTLMRYVRVGGLSF